MSWTFRRGFRVVCKSFRESENPIENLTPQYLLLGKGNSSTPFWWFLQDKSCWLPFLIQDYRLEWFSPSEVNIWRITFWEESMSWAQMPGEKFLANLWKWTLLWGPVLGGISLGVEDSFAKNVDPPGPKCNLKWILHSKLLGGGFKDFLCSSLFGEMIQIDEHIFQMGWNHQLDYIWTRPARPQNIQHPQKGSFLSFSSDQLSDHFSLF